MNPQEAVATLKNVQKSVAKTNDSSVKSLEKFKIILLNLRIDATKIKENTGIIPIADALDRNINELENSIMDLVSNYREMFIESINVIDEYINEKDVNDTYE